MTLAQISGLVAMRIAVNIAKDGGGVPQQRIIIDVGDAIVVWQPDGEVKTLRRKPADG